MNDGNGLSEVGELPAAGLEAAILGAVGMAPLMVACSDGDLAAAARLIREGADINQRSRSGATPLSIAQQRRDSALGELLLLAGADPSKMSHHDWEWLRPLVSKVAQRFQDRAGPKTRNSLSRL